MINLFENYTRNEVDLENSLKKSGYQHQTIVLNENGYLPNHVISPIGFFIKNEETTNKKPRFFNDLDLPEYWEIKGNNHSAEIFDGYRKKGNIKYSNVPGDYRLIRAIEWLNDEGRIRAIDLYNKFGERFGRETYSDGVLTLITYFDGNQREVILYNRVTGIIQLNFKKKSFVFTSYTEFILFFLKELKINTKEIIYNSLGTPFFVSNALKEKNPIDNYNHILFWQEKTTEVPDNMKYIINSNSSATKKIIIQDRQEFLNIRAQLNKKSTVDIYYLGFIYTAKKKPTLNKSALILTSSDQIYRLEELTKLLPNVEFKIAAYTEMSSKLLDFGKRKNVKLYEGINNKELDVLLNTSSIYLDINKGGEVGDILRNAFDSNLVLFSFFETENVSRFVSMSNKMKEAEYPKMALQIEKTIGNLRSYQNAIKEQRQSAGQAKVQDYKGILK